MNPPAPPETVRVGFRNPLLRRSPKIAELAQRWLLDYSRSHPGVVRSVTLITSGEPPQIELWVELPGMGDHLNEIVMGVQKLIESTVRETGLVMVPKSLIDQFSKPLDFQVIKC